MLNGNLRARFSFESLGLSKGQLKSMSPGGKSAAIRRELNVRRLNFSNFQEVEEDGVLARFPFEFDPASMEIDREARFVNASGETEDVDLAPLCIDLDVVIYNHHGSHQMGAGRVEASGESWSIEEGSTPNTTRIRIRCRPINMPKDQWLIEKVRIVLMRILNEYCGYTFAS
jgi:hypothetical protein